MQRNESGQDKSAVKLNESKHMPLQPKQEKIAYKDLYITQRDKINEELGQASASGNLAEVKRLVEEYGINGDEFAKQYGSTALIKAAENGHMDVVVYLVNKAKANLNACDNDFYGTALMGAVSSKHPEVLKFLINAKANVSASSYTRTALHHAVMNDELETARLLIEARANVDKVDRYGKTPLMSAIHRGFFPGIKLLVESKADVNAKVEDEAEETTMSVLAHTVTVDKGRKGWYIKDKDIASYLIEQGATTDHAGLEYLREQGVDVSKHKLFITHADDKPAQRSDISHPLIRSLIKT